MSKRLEVAQELATKNGANWDQLDEVMKGAYLHNADCAITEREMTRTGIVPGKPKYTCSICEDKAFIGSKGCHECNPRELPVEQVHPVVEAVPFDEPETSTGVGGGVVTTVGLLLQLAGKRTDEFSDEDLWREALEAAMEKIEFPYTIVMPCGETALKASPGDILDLPIEDVLCPCGDPNHYIIRFDDIREKPRELRPGEYFCTKCLKPHRATKSKLGQKHEPYAEVVVDDSTGRTG